MDGQVSMKLDVTRERNKHDSIFDERTWLFGEAKVANVVKNLRIMGEGRLFGLEISRDEGNDE